MPEHDEYAPVKALDPSEDPYPRLVGTRLYDDAVQKVARYIYQRGKKHGKAIGLKDAKLLAEVTMDTVEQLVSEY